MTSPGYVNVEPAGDVRPMPEFRWDPAFIDYDGHFAYRDLAARPSLRDRAAALTIFGVSMAKLLLKRAIRYEMIPYHLRSDRSPRGRLRFAEEVLAPPLHLQSYEVAEGDLFEATVRLVTGTGPGGEAFNGAGLFGLIGHPAPRAAVSSEVPGPSRRP